MTLTCELHEPAKREDLPGMTIESCSQSSNHVIRRHAGGHDVRTRTVRIARNGMMMMMLIMTVTTGNSVQGWISRSSSRRRNIYRQATIQRPTWKTMLSVTPTTITEHTIEGSSVTDPIDMQQEQLIFDDFVEFLLHQQEAIIHEIENTMEATSGAKFGRDCWGVFTAQVFDNDHDTTPDAIWSSKYSNSSSAVTTGSGGITRVLQNGTAIEKGACSLTVLRNGTLSAERAASIRGRHSVGNDDTDTTNIHIQAGDVYSAVALSMVLHSRNPMVPTFRSDVRMFQLVTSSHHGKIVTWLGGGADLTPYYLFRPDIQSFHCMYSDLCIRHDLVPVHSSFTYESMKRACDTYFYLPSRQEHRGTGGIFFDDMPVSNNSDRDENITTNISTGSHSRINFVKDLTQIWMPSWIPIVQQRNHLPYTDEQKYWQKLRRGRYLEFNLLYDRGVKFGFQTANPRVEGVMVSAPPEIAYEYNHIVQKGSPEAELLEILKHPISWI